MKISVVTPSFNQGAYLEATLRSLLAQNYPDLELIVIDGGSSDQSVEIIRRYASSISYWESEKDRGQSHALNKGFAHLHGEVWSWLNSDDLLEPGVLRRVADEFRQHPKAGVVYGDCLYVDEDGETVIEKFPGEPYSRLRHLAHRFIAQPSCFFRTSTVSPAVREDLHYCMDYDLWLRHAARGVKFHYVPEIFSRYRLHARSKSTRALVAMHAEIIEKIYRPILRRGAHGVEVEWLQKRLTAQGFPPGHIDGRFGLGTEAALLAYQRAHELLPDGIVDVPLKITEVMNTSTREGETLETVSDIFPTCAARRTALGP